MRHIKLILSIWATTFIYIIGGIDIALKCLLIMIGVDYFTGFSKAYYTNQLSSYRGLKGIIKKLNLLALVVVSNTIDMMLGKTGAIRTLTIYYIACNEGLSILENLATMNIIVPSWLKEKLLQVKKDVENGDKS